MAFLKSPFAPELPPVLRNERILLRTPEVGDFEAWMRLRMASRTFLTPWEPQWPSNDLTRSAYRFRIKRYLRYLLIRAALFAALNPSHPRREVFAKLVLTEILQGRIRILRSAL